MVKKYKFVVTIKLNDVISDKKIKAISPCAAIRIARRGIPKEERMNARVYIGDPADEQSRKCVNCNVKALYFNHRMRDYVSEKHDVDSVEKMVNVIAELIERVDPYQILITNNNQDRPPGVKKVK